LLEDIFTLNEWKNFFAKLLKANYLSWGGLATLPLDNPKFLNEDDGEKTKAYHQGNSWYFINNLLAYSLTKIDFKKFHNFIQKIIESSFLDLFFDGAIGWSSEISSAKERKSEGSLVQLWSITSLIFLLSFFQNINIFLKPLGNSHNVITIES
jgi:glycogen debranching enzyme